MRKDNGFNIRCSTADLERWKAKAREERQPLAVVIVALLNAWEASASEPQSFKVLKGDLARRLLGCALNPPPPSPELLESREELVHDVNLDEELTECNSLPSWCKGTCKNPLKCAIKTCAEKRTKELYKA